ncbi:hypothetical protein [Lysinibacillus sp. NPDC059133]|uniref:hypothetical protein n=1 Tax=Lysinibacillus sp. NPDC059133 TaxID=3346737 RepID=UPI0036ADF23E
MDLLMKYLNAIKNIKKRRYLTLLPIFMISGSIWSYWVNWRPYYDFGVIKYILFYPIVHWLLILCVLCYPHANYWIQTTWLYNKIFGNLSFLNQTFFGFSRLLEIDKNTPDEYVTRETYLRGTDGRIYRSTYLAEARGGKRHKARNKQINYMAIFILKDIFIRYLIHAGIFMISPLLFLIAVPRLDKKGYLKSLENSKAHI